MSMIVHPSDAIVQVQDGQIAFDELVALALQTVAASSARVYGQPFR